MATAGPRYPGTTASEVGPSGDNDWISTSPITADDGTEAQITAATYDAGDHSYRLKATNFGFDADVPAGSTINGITVEIDRRDFAGDAQDQEVRLYDSTGTLVGDDKQTADSWPATLAIATYGGAADTWTSGLDADDIRSAGFGVALIVLANSANTDIGVDFIRVTIDYTPPSPSGTGAISLAATTTSGTGVETFTATGAVTTAATTTDGTGAETFTATGAATLAAATVSGTGEEVFTATGAATLAATTTDGTGDHTGGAPENPTGTGAPSLAATTVEGTGSLGLTGTGAAALAAMVVSGTGVIVLTGSGAIALGVTTVSGTGVHTENATGTGAVAIGAATVAGDALHIENATGTGAIALPATVVAGLADTPLTGGHGPKGGGSRFPRPTTPGIDDDTVLLLYPFEDPF